MSIKLGGGRKADSSHTWSEREKSYGLAAEEGRKEIL